jgi:hypothetical protein
LSLIRIIRAQEPGEYEQINMNFGIESHLL